MAREDLERDELLRQLGQPEPGGGSLPDIAGAMSTPAVEPTPAMNPLAPPDAQMHALGGDKVKPGPVVPQAGDPLGPVGGGPTATSTGGVNGPTDPDAERAWRKELRSKAIGSQSGASHGWNTGDYGGDDVAATSMKNTFHAIAQRYPSTPSGLRQLVQDPDFQRAFPNASLVDHPTGDKIDFGGQLSDFTKGVPVGIVDVGRAFDGGADSGQGWDWMDEANSGGGGGGAMAGGLDMNALIGQGEDLTSGQSMQEILAAIEALSRGEDPSRAALLEQLAR